MPGFAHVTVCMSCTAASCLTHTQRPERDVMSCAQTAHDLRTRRLVYGLTNSTIDIAGRPTEYRSVTVAQLAYTPPRLQRPTESSWRQQSAATFALQALLNWLSVMNWSTTLFAYTVMYHARRNSLITTRNLDTMIEKRLINLGSRVVWFCRPNAALGLIYTTC